jgi:hypothetical protein
MHGSEFLETSHEPEAEHGPFSSSEWLVGILHPVVQPAADLAFGDGADLLQCGSLGCQPVCDNRFNQAMPSKRFS